MQQDDLSYAGHARVILRLGLPLIGGHLGQLSIGLTDSVMLGWYGVDALAAVTLAGTYYFVLFILGSGFASAVMPLVATFLAEDDHISIRRVTRMGLWLSILFCFAAMPALIWSEPIMILLRQDPEISALAADYLRIAGWGIFPALAVMVLKSYLAALERTQIVFWITLVAALANGLLNYALIFGNWGAPELGLRGAALASVATNSVMLIGVVTYALRVLPEHRLFQRIWRADWEMFGRVFGLGWPIGLTVLSEVGLFSGSAIMMGWLGKIPLAAHGIAVQLASITFMVHYGLANVATIRAGNALGRQSPERLKRGARVVIGMSLAMALATIVVFVTFPEVLIGLFLSRDEPARADIVAIGSALLVVAALFQLVDGAQALGLGLLRGLQDTGMPMLMAAFSYWAVGMPVSYVLGFELGFEGIGVWSGLVVGLACAAVLLMGRFWIHGTKLVPAFDRG